jgi:hypothetical protein
LITCLSVILLLLLVAVLISHFPFTAAVGWHSLVRLAALAAFVFVAFVHA